jgi:thiopurine S-methyltransferase
MELDQSFWESKYLNEETPWDVGGISAPIKAYIDELSDKGKKILIPGAGKAHEAVYLSENGFEHVYVCDWASHAFDDLREKCPAFPESQLLINDFFALEGKYDLIIEQTFFCAIDPSQRKNYASKTASLLNDGGKLIGLFFASEFDKPGPPFGGTKSNYLELFEPLFDVLEMHIAPNSILPRRGNELFFQMIVRK